MIGYYLGMHQTGVLLRLLLLACRAGAVRWRVLMLGLACHAGARRPNRRRVLVMGVLCDDRVSYRHCKSARDYG